MRLIPQRTVTNTVKDLNQFSAIVKEAFNYRRKTITNALRKLIPREKWDRIDIHPQARPQELTIEDFLKISNLMHDS